MAVLSQTRSGSLAEALTSERKTGNEQLRVAMPGIIQAFDPETVTAVVQPAIRAVERGNDGNASTTDYPLLLDVPVVFPRGGGCTLTFPVKAGDECLVIFADRCIDFWWQNGGIQEPVDTRMHDLSDAFAIVGPQSQAQKISNISTDAAQLRTDDGEAYIELNPESHDMRIITTGNVTASVTGSLSATITGDTTITSPKITLTGEVFVNGNVTVIKDVIASGKSLVNHTHGGVQPGGGNTGVPN